MNVEPNAFDTRNTLSARSAFAADIILKTTMNYRTTFIWPRNDEADAIGREIMAARTAGVEPMGNPKWNTLIQRQTHGTAQKMIMATTPKLLMLAKSCLRLSSPSQGIAEDIHDLRGIVERFAALEVTRDQILTIVPSGKIKTFEELLYVGEAISKLLGTRFDWEKHQFTRFEEMGEKTDYKKPEMDDEVLGGRAFQARSILNQIDKADKKIPGLRAYYNFCSEFVHPNLGDLIATTGNKKIVPTKYNQTAVNTTFCENPLDAQRGWSQYTVSRFLLADSYRFAAKIVEQIPMLAGFYTDILKSAVIANRRDAHKNIRRVKTHFDKSDYCPCGSGKKISACLKSN